MNFDTGSSFNYPFPGMVPLQCDLCLAKFREPSLYNLHIGMTDHSPSNVGLFNTSVCRRCGELNGEGTGLPEHQEECPAVMKPLEQLKGVKCSFLCPCGKHENAEKYHEHLRSNAKHLKPAWTCNLCCRAYISREGFDGHLVHFGCNGKPVPIYGAFVCGSCGSPFRVFQVFYEHVRICTSSSGLRSQEFVLDKLGGSFARFRGQKRQPTDPIAYCLGCLEEFHSAHAALLHLSVENHHMYFDETIAYKTFSS